MPECWQDWNALEEVTEVTEGLEWMLDGRRGLEGRLTRSSFRSSADFFCLCTWVDNLFSASASLQGPSNILKDFEQQLQRQWRIEIKPSFQAYIRVIGSTKLPANSEKWPLCDELSVLGHVLRDDGSTRSCWNRSHVSMSELAQRYRISPWMIESDCSQKL